jgi:AcrR family transcriptional regulator
MATGVREVHVGATRELILTAVTELITEGNPASVSVGDVARRAGVSERTVYRHYPTKDALFTAAVTQPSRRTETWLAGLDPAEVQPEELLERLWTELGDDLPTVRAQLVTPEGRALRAVRVEGRAQWAAAVLEHQGVDPTTPEGERLLHLVMALIASPTLIELHDTLGVPADRAAVEVGWAVRTLIDATRQESTRQEADGPDANGDRTT